MKKITTLEQAKSTITKETTETFHLGALNIGQESLDQETFDIMNWMFEDILPPLKIFKWGDILQQRKDKKFMGFNGMQNKAIPYHAYLHKGYSSLKMQGTHAGFGFKTLDGTEKSITNSMIPHYDEMVGSCYYHGAKGHWLTQSIMEEGLWAPIQGYTRTAGGKCQLTIHPGSVRSCIFEEMENEDMELMIWDRTGDLDFLPSSTFQDALDYWKGKLDKKERHLNISFLFTRGAIEWQTDLAELGFREKVFEFNKRITELSAGKPLSIYIGYDSTMNDLEKVCEKSIRDTIRLAHSTGEGEQYMKYDPVIKLLDISKLPDYNREYANQSTEFTYSRFLIPYLENYEGFSLFIDNDFIFKKSLLPMFNYLNPNDAVACIKYPQYQHDESKFNGEVNIDYPCKLWSSMMFFNNSHEDCKKLTPEVVNTWTGKQLHQFEWTNAISEIPQKYIFVEGYDNPDEKWDYTGIHYTRGGPWINDMDYSSINNLEVYHKYKNLYDNTK